MADDIVTRLRERACPECGLPSTHNQFAEAADEIERLRADCDRWRRIAHALTFVPWSLEYLDGLDDFRRAVRGD